MADAWHDAELRVREGPGINVSQCLRALNAILIAGENYCRHGDLSQIGRDLRDHAVLGPKSLGIRRAAQRIGDERFSLRFVEWLIRQDLQRLQSALAGLIGVQHGGTHLRWYLHRCRRSRGHQDRTGKTRRLAQCVKLSDLAAH